MFPMSPANHSHLVFLLEKLVKSSYTDPFCNLQALVSTRPGSIEDGGANYVEVIALLTEHEYCGTSQKPWIRHRFKKLTCVERWLTEVFELLLRVSFNSAADPMAVERVCNHTQRHNTRTLCLLTKALEICTKDYSKEPGQNKIYVATDSNGFIPGEEDISSQEEIEDAESERSGWATEEEWEEGYMLEAAVGKRHSGATNGQLSEEEHEENCTFKDYDKNTRSTSIIVSLTNVTMGWRPWQNSLTRV
ncbi:MAG: hypothetical protein M1821_000359 [Bathelium mastoideum]|nr:MAG: hypothetical protein M1821_000359 [Bathelium mastoideum]